jgi:hypothetical protein
MKERRPFLPMDKPKLWALSLLLPMVAMVVVAPAMFALNALGWDTIWLAIAFACYMAFIVRGFLGCYRNLQPKPWRKQVW